MASKSRHEVGVSPAGCRQNSDALIPLIDCSRPVALGKPSSIITPGSLINISHNFSLTRPPCIQNNLPTYNLNKNKLVAERERQTKLTSEDKDVISSTRTLPRLGILHKIHNFPLPQVIIITNLLSKHPFGYSQLQFSTESSEEWHKHHISVKSDFTIWVGGKTRIGVDGPITVEEVVIEGSGEVSDVDIDGGRRRRRRLKRER
ncbi:hypothetical protein Lal_00000107 [Lupinus albus]|nr:hypothetical protein Lal_00000107 [Lupinus albus]